MQFFSNKLESRLPLLGTNDHRRVPVRASDAPHGDVGGVAHEVRALVATLQGGPVEVPYRLLEDRLAVEVLHDHLSAVDVHPADVVEVDAPFVSDLLQHQLLVVEALGAQQSYGQGDRLDLRRAPRPRPRLHRLDALDLTRRPDHGYARVGRQVLALEVHVPERERLVVEAPGAFPDILGRRGEERLALPPLGLALARDERTVDLTGLEQRDQERAHEPAVLHAVHPLLETRGVALLDVPDAFDAVAVSRDLPGRLVLEAAARAEVPAQRATRAHLHERGQVVFPDPDRVRRAGRDAHAALHAAVGVYDRFFEVPEPDLPGGLFDVVHHLADVEAGHATSSRPSPAFDPAGRPLARRSFCGGPTRGSARRRGAPP